MGIPLNSSFTRGSAQPLDDLAVVADLTARDAISAAYRYEGLIVHVLSDGINYQLVGGITNIKWTDISGGAAGGLGGGMSITATQSIAGAGTISTTSDIQQLLKVDGAAGPQTTSTAPFDAPPADGTIITLLGMHAVNILKVPYSDTAEGCMLKGDCYLGLNDTLMLVYDETDQRYWEISRN